MSNVYKDNKTIIVLFVNKIDKIDKEFKLNLKKFI
jgi:translation elongation factor EF-G